MRVGPSSRSGFRLRRMVAVLAGKSLGLASRIAGREGAALPGVVALRLDPDLARDLSAQLAVGSIVVAGTNGKTTTSRLLALALFDAGFEPVRNESGSNLMRGVASALLRRSKVTGNLPEHPRAVGLFEVDEAALPSVLQSVTPRTILLLNLFRDQLDRYGEVATIGRLWAEALSAVPPSTSVVVNADDPLLVEASAETSGRLVFFSIESALRAGQSREHAADVKACPRCGGPIEYSVVFLGHLGHYACRQCDLRTPRPEVRALEIRLNGVEGSELTLEIGGEQVSTKISLPGMYNVYNALAAAAAASTFGLGAKPIAASLEHATPAFGRMERLEIQGRTVILALAKNPAGLNEILRTIVQSGPDLHLMMLLNDRIADGRDVSWIWDADVEMLAGRVQTAVFSGTRAEDMALRFKYAGVIARSAAGEWLVEHDVSKAFASALDMTPAGKHLFIVPTYTALLDVRKTLARLGYVRPYWEA